MTEEEKLAALDWVRSSQEVHALHCAKIKTKSGALVPFAWNRAQRYLHQKLEEQRERLGYVRALVLKSRQQGASTYIGHRFYWQTSTRVGRSAFIVAHEEKATSNLYSMVKRYHAHNPLAPSTQASNAKELIFGALDGGYKLATAGTDDVGRSNTAQLLHGSEFAFWRNAQMHLAGIGNTIPDGAEGQGTEIILESTANGMGNAFHDQWQQAEAGQTEYIAIFVPWYWTDEYRSPVRPDLELSVDDVKYQKTFGLDLQQMQWRANKIASYGRGYEWLFDQEYPAAAVLAFQTGTLNPLISPNDVLAAARSTMRPDAAPLIIGCDPAGDGESSEDRTAIAFRRGRVCLRIEYHERLSTMQVAGKLATYYNEMRPDGMFVDKGGLGAGIVDRLLELNIPVIGVNNAERAFDDELYDDRGTEMVFALKGWLEGAPVRIPNDPALIADICAPQPGEPNSRGRKRRESKRAMKKRGLRSPDGLDALALTFAAPVTYRVDAAASAARAEAKPRPPVGY